MKYWIFLSLLVLPGCKIDEELKAERQILKEQQQELNAIKQGIIDLPRLQQELRSLQAEKARLLKRKKELQKP